MPLNAIDISRKSVLKNLWFTQSSQNLTNIKFIYIFLYLFCYFIHLFIFFVWRRGSLFDRFENFFYYCDRWTFSQGGPVHWAPIGTWPRPQWNSYIQFFAKDAGKRVSSFYHPSNYLTPFALFYLYKTRSGLLPSLHFPVSIESKSISASL